MTKLDTHAERRARLERAHAYDPASEHDACGVGMVAAIDGEPRRDVVELALVALKAVWHRGAVDADGKTGDGAGLRIDVPQEFFRDEVRKTGHECGDGPIGVGMVFLPRRDFSAQERARAIVETEILRAGLKLHGWRQVPVNPKVLGEKADTNRPEIEQVLFQDLRGRERTALEKALFVARRRIENAALKAGLADLYLCSLSTEAVVYKGMVLAEHLDEFYPDLLEAHFVSRSAILHQRYSTNTFPEWRLAQPFRSLAHNGEINTIKGNINWMTSHEIGLSQDAFGEDAEHVCPIIQPGSSDSGALDQAFEALVRGGRDAALTKALLIPAAPRPSAEGDEDATRREALYQYCAAVMEPWDGPAAMCACDGRWAIAGLDRNGLRPLRWTTTTDGLLVAGSETGMYAIPPEKVARRGAVRPGGLVGVDLEQGRLYLDDELPDYISSREPYAEWVADMADIERDIGPGPEAALFSSEERRRRLVGALRTREDVEAVLRPMAETGKEAIGSMGDDTPLAVISENPRPLSHFFRQNFSQVTNPPIDPLREARVMSLTTRFRNLGAIGAHDGPVARIRSLKGPVLTNGMYQRLTQKLASETVVIDCTFERPGGPTNGAALSRAIKHVVSEAERALDDKAITHLVLTDAEQGPERAPIPMILATAAVHRRLLTSGARRRCAISVRCGETVDAHGAAVLLGVGATCVNPYLAFDAVADLAERGLVAGFGDADAAGNVKAAIEAGVLKILSKMGIAVLASYRGGCNFDLLGISRAMAAEYFPGAQSRISGIGLAGLESRLLEVHETAWRGPARLPVGGFYKRRASGEAHALEYESVSSVQKAVREDDQASFDDYVARIEGAKPIQLRDLLTIDRLGDKEVTLADVEPADGIRKRFVTPGMSLGALSPEAHGTLNVAMNQIGAKSVSGEGGENPGDFNNPAKTSAVKQIASGRFGVTAAYLGSAREIEIKVAQGAKPGEGGQLPGFKVTEFIARMRHSTPGVTLISPPPHHDIYSIEDLAQLIYDLKQINPVARVCVKLVSSAGVGTIAAGVAKAKADVILISGNVGGTGASPLTSIKFAGSPWELGLAEAHQVLSLNGLRDEVTLRTDGGLRTGRDIVMAAMLGAEEFGLGTISLVAMGCLMVRQCHSNTCPVGVCTQDDELRKKFVGTPEQVVRFMTFLAEDVRKELAALGAKTLDEVTGRTDLLRQVSRGAEHLDDLDLNPLLVQVDPNWRPTKKTGRVAVPDSLDAALIKEASQLFKRRQDVNFNKPVRNTDRGVGTRLSAEIVQMFGPDGLEPGKLTVHLTGSAGQSLGAFGAKGLRLIVKGDSNDYVGKGLSGAEIIIAPDGGASERHDDAIIGNTCLYGATSGLLLAAGRAGERFAVRNSGAQAVVEGLSANGCEYMTGGVVVVLGGIGDNFGAGMTGGEAFIYDQTGDVALRLNTETVMFGAFADDEAEARCRALVERHAKETKSRFAKGIVENWAVERASFIHITPTDAIARAALGLKPAA